MPLPPGAILYPWVRLSSGGRLWAGAEHIPRDDCGWGWAAEARHLSLRVPLVQVTGCGMGLPFGSAS